ncbi:hypothetical protein [Pectobacterium polaris]|uniref:hypothetical protein n=1 Tax=Pectobacterium polaris TaxID=2042057 RepID=UPI002B2436AD|nr:hypothetical protein [Pectobacterium polaris]
MVQRFGLLIVLSQRLCGLCRVEQAGNRPLELRQGKALSLLFVRASQLFRQFPTGIVVVI